MIEGRPFIRSSVEPDRRPAPAGAPRELGQEERDQDAERHRDRGRDGDDQRGADERRADPGRRALDQEVEAERAGAADDDRVDDDRQHGDGEHGRGRRARLGDPAEDLAAAQVAARRQRRGRVEAGAGAHLRRRPAGSSKRLPIHCATRFETSADHEQDHAEVEERGLVQLGDRPGELVGDPRRQGVAGLEQRGVDLGAGADHLGDRDRLAERAAEPEQRGGDTPEAVRRQDDPAHDLPAGRAERAGAVLDVRRHRRGRGRGRSRR